MTRKSGLCDSISAGFNPVNGNCVHEGEWCGTYWNQGYSYQQGYGPGYGGSDYSPHGYYGYGPGYYYRPSF
ncbi:Protein-Glutamine Gamma-Glutamyltransferase E [Manis pentadactyla]|nr:Protein-Glutamine Gamma-Glutamyltransferase E [Manis pentadactyla]